MKKELALFLFLVLFLPTGVFATPDNDLVRDRTGTKINGFTPDPNKCLGTKAENTNFKVGAGGDVDISKWIAIEFEPTSDGTVTFNNDPTKIRSILGGSKNVILIHPNVTQIVISVSAVVCGM